MKTGMVQVTPERLTQALGLPPATQILGIRLDPFRGGLVELVVQHETLPENCEGCIPPMVTFRSQFSA